MLSLRQPYSTPLSFALREAYTESKLGPQSPLTSNHDVIVDSGPFLAVFDGAGPHGREVAEICANVLATLPDDADERDFNMQATMELHKAYGDPEPGVRMPACTAAILSKSRAETWHYGDAASVHIWDDMHEVYQKELLWDAKFAECRRLINQMMIDGGIMTLDDLQDRDPGRDHFADVSSYQHAYANTPGPLGYTVLSALPVPDSMAFIVPVRGVTTQVVLMTDGYNIRTMKREDFLSREAADARLHEQLQLDPYGMDPTRNLNRKGLPRGHRYPDDRSYLSVMVL